MSEEDPEATEDNPDNIEREKKTTTSPCAGLYFLTERGKAQNGQFKTLNSPWNTDYGNA